MGETKVSSGRAGGVIVEAAQAACEAAKARLVQVVDAPDEQNPRLEIVTESGKKVTVPFSSLTEEKGVESVQRAIARQISKTDS